MGVARETNERKLRCVPFVFPFVFSPSFIVFPLSRNFPSALTGTRKFYGSLIFSSFFRSVVRIYYFEFSLRIITKPRAQMNNVSLGSSFQLTSSGFKEKKKEGKRRDYFLVADVSILRARREEIVPVSQESLGIFSSPVIVTT